MVQSQELSVQQKKELAPKEEKTVPARYYVPNTDIYETDEALTLVMEVPGVEKKDVNASAGRQHLPNQILAFVHREHEDLGFRHRLADAARRLEAVQLGHREVKHGDLRPVLDRHFDRLAAGGGLGANAPAQMLFQEFLEAPPDDAVVIGQENAENHGVPVCPLFDDGAMSAGSSLVTPDGPGTLLPRGMGRVAVTQVPVGLD